MTASLQALRIAVLGEDAQAFAQAVQQALSAMLQGAPSRPLLWHTGSVPASRDQVDLCWLLAWDEASRASAAQALDGLQAHNDMRRQLHAIGLGYQVLRASAQQRQQQALHSLAPWLPELAAKLPRLGEVSRRPGSWSCEKCGDPDCEHRSFTELLARREPCADQASGPGRPPALPPAYCRPEDAGG